MLNSVEDNKELKKNIAKWYNSSVYHKLSSHLQRTDFFKILGVSRNELQHSKFIAWLLNPNETHDLGEFPLRKFLQLLAMSRKEESEFPENLENGFVLGNYKFGKSIQITTEEFIQNKKNRLDIVIKDLSIENISKEFFILIENKVGSQESQGQTQTYYDWAKSKCEQKNSTIVPICVFLHPSDTEECECNKFINITYQDLVNMVIEPCLLKTNSDKTIFYIKEYLKTLSYSPENPKMLVMAFSNEEKELCQIFFEENKKLLNDIREKSENELCKDFFKVNKKMLTYIREVLNSSRYLDNDFKDLSKFIENKDQNTRDYTKYSFNNDGKKYYKGRLALKIFQEASKQYNTLDKLKEVFQEMLNLHAIKGEKFITDDMAKSKWAKKDYKIRFFTKPDEQIKLGEKNYYLTNQWGKGADFDKLLEIARNTLKFEIKEI